ncbi:MAG: CDP-alcohol phosphatidyltransferase family protein [Micromonosporaceae bacterium]
MGTPELTVSDWDGYAARWSAMHGGFDPRYAVPWVQLWMRSAYRCGRALARLSVSAATITAIGAGAAVATPLALLLGPRWALLAASLVLVTGLSETLDSAVAVITGKITPLGSFYQAISARAGEAAWLTALWLAGAPGWLVAGAGALTWLHEYARTQATMAGTSPARMVTMAERPMRLAVAAVGLLLAGLAVLISEELAIGAATMAGTVWLLLSAGGLIQLADSVHGALR